MLALLQHGFALVCGQNPGHTWAPGGLELPCCQRCTGLYAGACIAALLHLWLRPKQTARFLELHGAFLLLMVPFGFHWLPQGPILRTFTGLLFGFGLVAFLALPLSAPGPSANSKNQPPWPWAYALILLLTLVLTTFLAAQGGRWAAFTLSGLALCGALALATLVVANTLLALRGALRLARRLHPARTPGSPTRSVF